VFKVRLTVFLAFAITLVACAPASDLQVLDVWARPALAGGNSAVYFNIENSTGTDDTLVSAKSDVAGAVELHMTSMQDGNMQMMPQDQVLIKTGETKFEPGGFHVMLIGLNQNLNPGDTFSLTLDFAKAGSRPLRVTVSEP
jgi:copper(I)-binding protein